MKITDAKTNGDLLTCLRELGNLHITALNGIMPSVPDALKAEYTRLRDDVNAALEKLPPLDQVPAAQDAAWAFQAFARTIQNLYDYSGALAEQIKKQLGLINANATALQSFTDKLSKGELIEKANHLTLVETAVTAAKDPLIKEIGALRGQAIALCGLPAAPDSVLTSATDAFNASLEQAKKNLTALAARGFKLGGTGDAFIKKTAWLQADAFQGEDKTLADLAETLKVKLPTTAKAGEKLEPLQGGDGAKTPTTGQKLSFA